MTRACGYTRRRHRMGGAGRARQLRRHRHRFHRPVGPAAGLFSETFYKNCFLGHWGPGCRRRPERIAAVSRQSDRVGTEGIQGRQFPRRRQPVLPAVHLSLRLVERHARLQGRRPVAVPPCRRRKKSFPTRYYNAAIHTAALATPSSWSGSCSEVTPPYSGCNVVPVRAFV